jgi:hypothetical protein
MGTIEGERVAAPGRNRTRARLAGRDAVLIASRLAG